PQGEGDRGDGAGDQLGDAAEAVSDDPGDGHHQPLPQRFDQQQRDQEDLDGLGDAVPEGGDPGDIGQLEHRDEAAPREQAGDAERDRPGGEASAADEERGGPVPGGTQRQAPVGEDQERGVRGGQGQGPQAHRAHAALQRTSTSTRASRSRLTMGQRRSTSVASASSCSAVAVEVTRTSSCTEEKWVRTPGTPAIPSRSCSATASVTTWSTAMPRSAATRSTSTVTHPFRAPTTYSSGVGAVSVPPAATGSSRVKRWRRRVTSVRSTPVRSPWLRILFRAMASSCRNRR